MARGLNALRRVTRPTVLACLLSHAATGALAEGRDGAAPVTVFAAASLHDAVQAVLSARDRDRPHPIRFSVAASSLLARQIEAGAPADIFLSANARWMDHLDRQGLLEPATRARPLGNALVLVASDASPALAPGLASLPEILGPHQRLALADPAHVPAGLYAREALEALGLWAPLATRLAIADNVRGALALVARGEAPFGVVYATDARLSDRVTVAARFPPSAHAPIEYHFAIVRDRATRSVRALYAQLIDAQAKRVFAAHGFRVAHTEGRARAQ